MRVGPSQPAPVEIEPIDLSTQGPIHFTYRGEENTYGTRARDGRMIFAKIESYDEGAQCENAARDLGEV